MSSARRSALRTAALTTAAAGALLSVAALTPASAMAAMIPAQHTSSTASSQPNFEQRMINANMTGHDIAVTIKLGDGTELTQYMADHTGWYPTADFTGINTVTVRDAQGVAMVATFSYDMSDRYHYDWHLISVDPGSRIHNTWHTGDFGGFDFR